jgi:hypothetical protein
MSDDKSCWNCDHIKLGGNCFPGKCDKDNVEIDPAVVDKGCEDWRPKCCVKE